MTIEKLNIRLMELAKNIRTSFVIEQISYRKYIKILLQMELHFKI